MTESLRRAALCLHALAPADRRWVMRRLSAEHVPTLRTMVRELETMGIPREDNLLTAMDPASSVPTPGNRTSSHRSVSLASASDIAPLLKGESPEIVAALLMADDWPWREAFLKTQNRLERERLNQITTSGKALPAEVQKSLVAFIHQQLPAIEESSAGDEKASASRNGSARWWNRFDRGVLWRR